LTCEPVGDEDALVVNLFVVVFVVVVVVVVVVVGLLGTGLM